MLNSREVWTLWHTGSALAIHKLDSIPLWPFPSARKEHFLAYIYNSSNPICSIRIGYHKNKEYQRSDLCRYDGLPYKINNPMHCVSWVDIILTILFAFLPRVSRGPRGLILNSGEVWSPWQYGPMLNSREVWTLWHTQYNWLGTSNTQIRFHPPVAFPPGSERYFLACIYI